MRGAGTALEGASRVHGAEGEAGALDVVAAEVAVAVLVVDVDGFAHFGEKGGWSGVEWGWGWGRVGRFRGGAGAESCGSWWEGLLGGLRRCGWADGLMQMKANA